VADRNILNTLRRRRGECRIVELKSMGTERYLGKSYEKNCVLCGKYWKI
jgi:hypothetical protein